MSEVIIRNIEGTDNQELYLAWNDCLKDWPVPVDQFKKRIGQPGSKTFALGGIADSSGFISIVANEDRGVGQVTALVVDQSGIDKGYAQQLLDHAMQCFSDKKVKEVKLCSGAGSYFWPGVPTNLPHLKKLFEDNGFNFYEVSVDMIQDLSNYKTPEGVIKKALNSGFSFRNCSSTELKEILKFEEENFPNWHKYYQEVKDPADILVAWREDRVVGTCLALPPYAQGLGETFLWKDILGSKVGGVGSLGAHEDTRGKGIGLALAAKATEHIGDKGAEVGFLGWTWLAGWYGQLGYKVWREYDMGSKKFDQSPRPE